MAYWVLTWLFAFIQFSYAEEKVLAVVSYKSSLYENFYESLESKLDEKIILEKTAIADLREKNLSAYDLVISIGSDASKILSRTGNINSLLYTLIPGTLAESIGKRPCLAKKCLSVLIEQPADRYFQLFKLIFPRNRTLAIATTSKDPGYLAQLKSTAQKYSTQLKIIPIDKNTIIARSLIKGLTKNDVLLALPDPNIYNKDTAKSIILSAYHKNVPIIGYSQAFAKAGALISLYSSLDDIASQTEKLASNSRGNTKNYYPNAFSIEINRSVAVSLEIQIKDINELMRAIK
ncbi:MAG: ABC transporter substrate binding protein [Gammaproteobacteria bacterium]